MRPIERELKPWREVALETPYTCVVCQRTEVGPIRYRADSDSLEVALAYVSSWYNGTFGAWCCGCLGTWRKYRARAVMDGLKAAAMAKENGDQYGMVFHAPTATWVRSDGAIQTIDGKQGHVRPRRDAWRMVS